MNVKIVKVTLATEELANRCAIAAAYGATTLDTRYATYVRAMGAAFIAFNTTDNEYFGKAPEFQREVAKLIGAKFGQ